MSLSKKIYKDNTIISHSDHNEFNRLLSDAIFFRQNAGDEVEIQYNIAACENEANLKSILFTALILTFNYETVFE